MLALPVGTGTGGEKEYRYESCIIGKSSINVLIALHGGSTMTDSRLPEGDKF